jgi:hypothetical protein
VRRVRAAPHVPLLATARRGAALNSSVTGLRPVNGFWDWRGFRVEEC